MASVLGPVPCVLCRELVEYIKTDEPYPYWVDRGTSRPHDCRVEIGDQTAPTGIPLHELERYWKDNHPPIVDRPRRRR